MKNSSTEQHAEQEFREKYFKPVYVYLAKPPKSIIDDIEPYDMDDEIIEFRSFSKKEKDECVTLYISQNGKIRRSFKHR
jgi:hypothetical protein